MKVKEYIESGVLESYVLGSASEEETKVLMLLKGQYPEIQEALFELETDLERMAQHMAIPPPPGMFIRIEESINDLVKRPEALPEVKHSENGHSKFEKEKGNNFIEVESESSHMRIHKVWRWVFAAVFILGKIFLATAIYYYLENRQAQQQIENLKIELQQSKILR